MTEPINFEQIRNQITMAANGHRHEQRGYFALKDLPQKPDIGSSAISPGWDVLADLWKLYPGQFTIVTGSPGHGKSTLMLNVVCNIAKTHDWRTFMYVPENEAFLQYKLRRIFGPRGYEDFSKNQCFVQSAETQSYDQVPKSIDWVLDRAVVGIRQDGVNLLMIDPWNELEHAKPRDWSMTEYITHCLMYLKQFVRAHNVAVIVVAHPTKAHASEGRQPSLYDIESSAAWFNKCDNGLVVSRDPETDHMTVSSAKVRERGAGKRGKCLLLVNEYEQVTDLSGVVA